MEDSWLCIEDDDSNHSASDSDVIDSETEAELYSTIHYEENLNSHNTESINFLTTETFAQNSHPGVLLTPIKDNFGREEKRQNVKFQSMNTFKAISKTHDNDLRENQKSPDRLIFSNNQLIKNQNASAAEKRKIAVQKLQQVNLSLNDSKCRDLNESSRHKSSSHVQTEISDSSSNVNLSFQKLANTIVIDSSDSDCDMWTDINSVENSNFETNLLKDSDTIYLSSSDSGGELPTSSLNRRDSILKNLSMPNIKIGENQKGPWHINDEDLYRKRKYTRRYHGNIDVTCSHCNKKGHSFKTCPVPKKIKCFICGGAHLGARCMNKMCSNCCGYGHDRKRCQMRPNNLFCLLCSVKGHTDQNCPDLWRRYHLTTEPVNIVKGKRLKQDINLYCWNCGDHGHYGSFCKTRLSSSLTTQPCVISYDNPEGLLKKRLDDAKSRRGQFRWDEHLKHRSNINVTFNTFEGRKSHFCQRNQSNTREFIGKKGDRKKRRKKNAFIPRKKMDMQFKKFQNTSSEGDFPRTPKAKKKYKSEMPESVELIMKRQRNNTESRNRRRKNQKLRRLTGNLTQLTRNVIFNK